MVESISQSYKGKEVSIEQLKHHAIEKGESLRYHPLLGYRVIKKIAPEELTWSQSINYRIGQSFFSLIYGRDLSEAAKNAWKKLEEELPKIESPKIQARLLLSKQRDCCLPDENKLVDLAKLTELAPKWEDGEELSSGTKRILNNLFIEIQNSEAKHCITDILRKDEKASLKKSINNLLTQKKDELKSLKKAILSLHQGEKALKQKYTEIKTVIEKDISTLKTSIAQLQSQKSQLDQEYQSKQTELNTQKRELEG